MHTLSTCIWLLLNAELNIDESQIANQTCLKQQNIVFINGEMEFLIGTSSETLFSNIIKNHFRQHVLRQWWLACVNSNWWLQWYRVSRRLTTVNALMDSLMKKENCLAIVQVIVTQGWKCYQISTRIYRFAIFSIKTRSIRKPYRKQKPSPLTLYFDSPIKLDCRR